MEKNPKAWQGIETRNRTGRNPGGTVALSSRDQAQKQLNLKGSNQQVAGARQKRSLTPAVITGYFPSPTIRTNRPRVRYVQRSAGAASSSK